MQSAEHLSLAIVVIHPHELVGDQLLREVDGDVLLIRSTHVSTMCTCSARKRRRQLLACLYLAGTDADASFIAGRVSARGGRFQVISREQAVELLARWIVEQR
ncbi:hypothetical protein [Desulfogranum marinum]|uniref:hypothetical protein n=1 Tax=Desulfogranum marinum TaxID=453220 RepID=UPI0019655FF0|nr:hypothetical protein [Desulfogranum marinum]MBM9514263.1 hypothetical protein [Desulfogranum marinum]